MLTKYKLIIGSDEYELRDDDLRNWDEMLCKFARAEYGGVVRSFTSKFEFVNTAYKKLMAEFDKKGFLAHATLELYVIDNNWNYHLAYTCDLDFSTLTYTDYVLSMHARDNAVASIIKAKKATKFEFTVGEDIPVNGTKFLFDRIKMLETATYAITEGTNGEDGSLTGQYTTDMNGRIYVGLTNNELAVGKAIHLLDDQTNGNGYMFEALKSLEVTLDYSIVVGKEVGCARLVLMKNNVEIRELHGEVPAADSQWKDIPDLPTIGDVYLYIHSHVNLREEWLNESCEGRWITVQGIVWVAKYAPGGLTGDGHNEWVDTGRTRAEYCGDPKEGTKTFEVAPGDKIWLKFDSDRNRPFKIYSSSLKFTWEAKGKPELIDSIAPRDLLKQLLVKMGIGYDAVISDYANKFSSILILPAECIRDVPNPKVYLSFSDFCKWIEAVFGYTYVIDEDNKVIEFKHRNEIFSEGADILEIEGAQEFEYNVERTVLYSSVVVGYDKKDYDSVNGRDEFNFNSTYTTGYNFNDRKIELKSPFRADSYGIEFLVEKRGQDTTDNNSDKDIFFVSGVEKDGYFQPNRTPAILNSITGTLINGEFSPMSCVHANSGYISLMAKEMTLAFASTEGNGNITIDGVGMSDDLLLDTDMLTAGELKFVCADQRMPKDMNCLIRVKSKKFIYEGYIREATFMLARPEAVEYVIMVKSQTPC